MVTLRRELASQPADLVEMLVEQACAMGLLERSDRPIDPRVEAMSALGRWNPEAGFFHMSTRDVPFSSPQQIASLARQARGSKAAPMPPPVKKYPRAAVIELPQPSDVGEFPDVLKARRTWRRYGATPVTIAELATVLGLSAGVQFWVGKGRQRSALKTSPSGGARHPIECYVVARNVKGLRPGIYHYASDTHRLERIGGAVPVERLKAYMPNSGYFAAASAMVFFTAVFARIRWRYPLLPCLSRRARRGRTRLPDLLPGSDLAAAGAVLRHGPRRQPHRAGPRHRRDFGIRPLRGRRRPSAAGRGVGAPASRSATTDPAKSEFLSGWAGGRGRPGHPNEESSSVIRSAPRQFSRAAEDLEPRQTPQNHDSL